MSTQNPKDFSKILIANRGEIACRIIRTARKLGIQTVAVYSEADSHALHVQQADESYCLGPAPASESYLVIPKIIQVAQETRAQAIHPGYGFLSENAAFAQACQDAGIEFIGPPASAISAMGSKSEAKLIMEKASVPMVPGYHGNDQSTETLQKEALKIGFPVLIKAAMGGGGKGMRVIEQESQLVNAIEAAKREAEKSFGSAELLLEKYIPTARHVEVQVFFDKSGNAVHLFDRDCSVQRRHQKIIEEAPAPNIPADVREAMYEAAINAGRAIDYVGAGTVEFLLAPDNAFYFMEMNTRLQVEHPVTEQITGLDLVEWQLHVAAGLPLPLSQQEITQTGHSVEVRIYAENPANDYLPSTGTLELYQPPAESSTIRLDSGVKQGDAISSFYDPMIAKLISHSSTRKKAIAELNQSLKTYWVEGVQTNIHALTQLLDHPAFQAGQLSTLFLQEHAETLSVETGINPALALSMATLAMNHAQTQSFAGFRANTAGKLCGVFIASDNWASCQLEQSRDTVTATIQRNSLQDIAEKNWSEENTRTDTLSFELLACTHDTIRIAYQHRNLQFRYALINRGVALFHEGEAMFFNVPTEDQFLSLESSTLDCNAPMTGAIVKILVQPGEQVSEGSPLLVLEAMKMEHTLTASRDAVVEEVLCHQGDQVSEGQKLIHLADPEEISAS